MWAERNPASLGASEDPTRSWHSWAGKIQRVVTPPLCKVRKPRLWFIRRLTPAHSSTNTFAVYHGVCLQGFNVCRCFNYWERFLFIVSSIVLVLPWIRRKGHIADSWFQDDESFMNYPLPCSFLLPVFCHLCHRAIVFLSPLRTETVKLGLTPCWQPCLQTKGTRWLLSNDPSDLPPRLTFASLWFLCFAHWPRDLTLVLTGFFSLQKWSCRFLCDQVPCNM